MEALDGRKMLWLAGLLGRLLAVLILDVLLLCLGARFFSESSYFKIASGPFLTILWAGFTWAFHFHSPFLTKYPPGRRWRLAAIMAVVLTVVVSLCIFVALSQVAFDYKRARIASSANPANEVWFYDGGFLDRDLWLYVKPRGGAEQFVANLEGPDSYRFSHAQWTKDGQVIICSLILLNDPTSDQPVMGVAYDFGTNQAVLPQWLADPARPHASATEWKNTEAIIQKLVTAHGGLNGSQIDDDMLRAQEKPFWFWHMPGG